VSRLAEIEKQITRRKAQLRLFLRYAKRAGERPFYGFDPRWASEREMIISVTPDLQGKGWRVTWFADGEPGGHTVRRTFAEAVEEAVTWHGLDLNTVRFIADRDPRARRSAGQRTRGSADTRTRGRADRRTRR
jgi:hypothetical protein